VVEKDEKMKIKVFGKQGCDACKQMREKMEHRIEKWGWREKVLLDYIDMSTVDGMAEGAFNDVFQVPTVIVENEGSLIARYDGGVADSRELKERMEGLLDDSTDQRVH